MNQVDEFVRIDLLFIIFVSLYLLAKKTAIDNVIAPPLVKISFFMSNDPILLQFPFHCIVIVMQHQINYRLIENQKHRYYQRNCFT